MSEIAFLIGAGGRGKYTHQMKDYACVDGRDINHVYMMRPSLNEEVQTSEERSVSTIESPDITAVKQSFDDMVRDSAGNVFQCTGEILAANRLCVTR
jgi:hypothetical protein